MASLSEFVPLRGPTAASEWVRVAISSLRDLCDVHRERVRPIFVRVMSWWALGRTAGGTTQVYA